MPRPPVHVPPPPKQGPSPALIGAVVAIAVVLVAVIAYVALRPDPVDTANGGDNASVTGDGTSPNALPNAGGIRVGDAGDDVPRVHVYVDFQCPWCGQLERTSGADIYQAAQDGDIQLTYTVMSFLDGNLRNDSSSRAANAALCADDQGVFAEFTAAAFAGQPEEGAGYTDEQLTSFAETAGVKDMDAFNSCMADGTHADYVTDMQTRSTQDGITGTPRVLINGEELSNEDMNTLIYETGSFPAVLAANTDG